MAENAISDLDGTVSQVAGALGRVHTLRVPLFP